MRLFAVVPASHAASRLLRFVEKSNIVFAVVSVVFGGFTALSLAVAFFCLAAVLTLRVRRFRASPFSLIFGFGIWSYFAMPLTFIALLGNSYVFGMGLAEVPATSAEYVAVAPAAIMFLALCVIAVCAGLALGTPRGERVSADVGTIDPSLPVGLLVAAVAVATFFANASAVQDTIVEDASHGESLLFWIFSDYSCLVLTPLIYFARLNKTNRWATESTTRRFLFALLALWVVSVAGGSKGYVLAIANLSFVLAISFLKERREARVVVPSRLAILLGVPLSVGAFAFSYALRFARLSGESVSALAALSDASSDSGRGLLTFTLNEVAYRLSAVVDRYVLLFYSFVHNAYDGTFAREFGGYIVKNFINLIMPGTPFHEAYEQSSNLLSTVLFKRAMENDLTRTELLRSLNTQPYTLFGVMMIVAGVLAPVLLFVFSFALARAYSFTRHALVRIALLTFFLGAITSYGPEVVAAESGHVLVTVFVFIVLLRLTARVFNTGRPYKRSRPPASPKRNERIPFPSASS